jgi:hypothetical protein
LHRLERGQIGTGVLELPDRLHGILQQDVQLGEERALADHGLQAAPLERLEEPSELIAERPSLERPRGEEGEAGERAVPLPRHGLLPPVTRTA